MRTYKLTVAYDGTRYQGWQRQVNTELTIQGILERCLEKVLGMPTQADGSGRTDSGVHAVGQTVSVVLPGKREETAFRQELNEHLPEDIRIMDISLMKNGFHARYDVKGKTYEYVIDTREKPDVFHRRYAYHFPEELNIEEMERAARLLEGRHDFSAFTDKKEEQTKVRNIYKIEIVRHKSLIRIQYTGNGYMYHMVRILTGTLLEVGRGTMKISDVKQALIDGKREQAGFLAPACGLTLKEVYY